MTTANRQRAFQEIDRRGSIERDADLDGITRFARRLARWGALLPPSEASNFADQPANPDLR